MMVDANQLAKLAGLLFELAQTAVRHAVGAAHHLGEIQVPVAVAGTTRTGSAVRQRIVILNAALSIRAFDEFASA